MPIGPFKLGWPRKTAFQGSWAAPTWTCPLALTLAIAVGLLVPALVSAADPTVYVTKTGSKYHTSTCSSLSKSRAPLSLSDAVAQGYTPCARCKPPGGKPSPVKPQKEVKTKGSSGARPAEQCEATTKNGTQCKRRAQPGSRYCWQHGG